MPSFTIQVEVLGGGDEAAVRSALRDAGFRTEVQGESGALYRLPRMTFVADAGDRISVLQRVKACLAAQRATGRAVVTEAAGRSWSNLEELPEEGEGDVAREEDGVSFERLAG